MLTITQNGIAVAYLTPESDGLKDVWIEQQLNGPCTLSFSLPMDSEKWSYLNALYRIECDNKEFVILNESGVEVTRDGQKIWGKVQAEESWVLLGQKYPSIPPAGTPVGELIVTILRATALEALTQLLQNTGWSIGIVDDVTTIHDLETEKLTTLANINKVQEIWGGYLIWDSINKTVSLRAETWKPYTGFRVQYAKNEKNITRTIDYNIITRLYPFGEDDLNIASVNNNVIYLDNFQYTDQILEGIKEYPDIDDPQELKSQAITDLEKLSKPRANYKVSIVDIRNLPGYEHETFALGDIVDIYDPDISPDGTQVRIIRYKYNVLQPWQCELEIGDPVEKIDAMLAQVKQAAEVVGNSAYRWNRSRVFNPNNTLDTTWLNGVIDVLKNKLSSSVSNWWTDENGNIIFETIDHTSAMMLTGNGFMIANSRDISNNWVWRTFGTGNGFTADEINTGRLRTSLVEIFGNAEFYWDGDNIYILNPSNYNQQIRIGKYDGTNYGIAFTTDGGTTWETALNFSGLYIGPNTAQFASGYDPSTKETPEGAQQKANTAQSNAEAYANQILQSLANGSYTGGTFINGTSIISPVIGGNYGVFTGTVKVGTNGPIVIDGVNKKITIDTYNYIDSTGIHVSAANIRGTLDASKVNVVNLNASNITTGIIDASRVNVVNLNASNITTGTLTGITLNGVTVNAIDTVNIGATNAVYNPTIVFRNQAEVGSSEIHTVPTNPGSSNEYDSFDIIVNSTSESYKGKVWISGWPYQKADLEVTGYVYTDRIKGYLNNNQIYLGTGNCRIDTSSSILRMQQSSTNYMSIGTDGTVTIYVGSTAKHVFYADGTKLGGSIVIDNINYGLSPIDSPEFLIADIMRNVNFVEGDNEIMLDDKTAKILEGYSVFFENSDGLTVTAKNLNSFIVHSSKNTTTDILIVGNRIGYKDVRWVEMTGGGGA